MGALVAGAACAGNADTFLDVTYDPCTARALPADATADEIASLDAALSLWNVKGGFRLRRAESGGDQEPPLVVRFSDSLGVFRGFYDDEAGEISIHRGLESRPRTVALAHELGHAFGLWHVERAARPSVMNPGNLTVEPTARDIADVRELWGSCD